jgi:putative ABC transport system permease protein
VVGIYAAFSYSVTHRRQEIAIRMAIGASRGDILVLILRRAVVLIVCGTAAGLIAARIGSGMIADLLYEVSPTDGMALMATTLFVAAIGLLSSLIPAWVASRADPTAAMRTQ